MTTYCTIYVYTRLSFDQLIGRVAGLLGVTAKRRTIQSGTLIVDVVKNDEFDERLADEGAGDFVYYPYLLEVDDADNVRVHDDADPGPQEKDPSRQALVGLLAALAAQGFDFVTVADFEEELPNHGRSRP